MGLIDLLFKDPISFFILVIPLLYSVIVHEVSHGFVAEKFGDPTARMLGRLTLRISPHIDPLGTLCLFLFGFGWAKPVPVNFYNIKNYRKGLIWVSAAGPLSNIFIATICLFIYKSFGLSTSISSNVLLVTAQINVILAAFNLIPIPPLDGSKVLMGLSSDSFRLKLESLEPYGMFIIIILLVLGILHPLISFLMGAILFFIEFII
jgi:Zn-dependent protease